MAVDKKQSIREAAENDLETFIRLVHPQTLLGNVHLELIQWWARHDAKAHSLVLLPRDHQKSRMVAYRVAQAITKNPAVRVLYISSTSNLAIKQIKFIKDILTSDRYRFYWPEMVHPDEGKREKWAETEFSVDHPIRKAEAVRDPTVFTAGLTTSITGMHCDIAVLDDVVTYENAYTEDGRSKVQTQYSYLASIESTDSQEWVVGTRYHPKDLYQDMISMEIPEYDSDGNTIAAESMYDVFEKQVENRGDGTGEFIWPRQTRYDGKVFGFDDRILAQKRAKYLDQTQFYAQYYNNPNAIAEGGIPREYFQYYDPKFLSRRGSYYYYQQNRLNVFAAIDFAYSLNKKADYTAIVVVGCDYLGNYYVLEIDRFKTDNISEYFKHILELHQKWDFRKIRAEVTAAQAPIVKNIKDDYIKRYGLALTVEDHKPTRYEGSKEERIKATLQARYQNGQMWHYQGGNTQVLEEELVLAKPPHDDVKDCLASCIDICVPPSSLSSHSVYNQALMSELSNTRFGGIL